MDHDVCSRSFCDKILRLSQPVFLLSGISLSCQARFVPPRANPAPALVRSRHRQEKRAGGGGGCGGGAGIEKSGTTKPRQPHAPCLVLGSAGQPPSV